MTTWSPYDVAPTAAASRRPAVVRAVVSAVVVVVVFAAVGAGDGWLWHQLWNAPAGEAVKQTWYPLDETSLGGMFDATGLYLIIGFGSCLVLGVLTGLLVRRHELAMLAAVVVGSAAAALLCHVVGFHLSPPDPTTVAATAADNTRIPDNMSTPGHTFYAAWPLGALVGLALVYLVTLTPSPQSPESSQSVPPPGQGPVF